MKNTNYKADENLLKGAKLFAEDWISSYPDETECKYTYSEKHNKRMERMFKHKSNFFYRITSTPKRRLATVILSLFLSFNMLMVFSTEVRAAVFSFFITTYEEFSNVIFPPSEVSPDTILDKYEPTYIPDGFEAVYVDDSFNSSYNVEYYNKDIDVRFDFSQETLGDSPWGVDTEDAVVENISIHSNDALLVYKEKYNIFTMFWSNEEYLFIITGLNDRDEIIKVAESVDISLE